ncbi:MAG: hypothetical protein QOE65_2984 [Solirubrobacteraceae bacterium]|jgi:hypothetical protein|nr:hypothetical protein [Solirubrobacteraceae bacterium]
MRPGEGMEFGTTRAAWADPYDAAVYDEATSDDRALAGELAAVAREVRARQWLALEGLLALVSGLHGELDDRYEALPDEEVVPATRAILLLGWVDDYS